MLTPTGLYLSRAAVERCVNVDRDSERRWRPVRVGRFAGAEVRIVDGEGERCD